jgi:hypothetical protein
MCEDVGRLLATFLSQMKGECNEMLLKVCWPLSALLALLYKLQSRKGMLGSKDQGGGVDGDWCHLLGVEQCMRSDVMVEQPEQNTSWNTGCMLKDNINTNFKER